MKELSDFAELELKFLPEGDEERILQLIRDELPPAWSMIKRPPEAVLDLYFDDAAMNLYRRDALFRCRRAKRGFGRKNGYNANFKYPRDRRYDFMHRRELRTMLGTNEVLAYETDGIPGLAAEAAYRFLADVGAAPRLRPVVQVVSDRHEYGLLPPERALDDRSASSALAIMLERVTAIDVRSADAQRLIRTGVLCCTTPLRSAGFELGEIELYEVELERQGPRAEESQAAFTTLRRRFEQQGVPMLLDSKYVQAVRALGLGQGLRQPLPDARRAPREPSVPEDAYR